LEEKESAEKGESEKKDVRWERHRPENPEKQKNGKIADTKIRRRRGGYPRRDSSSEEC